MASDASATEGAGVEDWARLRAIAEEGRQRPLLGGPPLVIWGVAIAIAALGHWAVVARILPVSPAWLGPWWLATTVTGALTTAVWRNRLPDAGSAPLSTGNRVSEAVWRLGGLFLGALALGLFLSAMLASWAGAADPWLIMSVIPPVSFGVYGIALAATGEAAGLRWLRQFAWVPFGFAVGTAAIIGEPAQFFFMAAGAITCLVVPGVRLMRTGGRG